MTASEFGSMDPMHYPTDLHVLKAWLVNRCIDVELKEHKLYTLSLEFSPVFARLVGTDHLIASSDQGKISVIRGMASFGDYEIYSLEGGLFEDIERYPNVKTAGERIHQLLRG